MRYLFKIRDLIYRKTQKKRRFYIFLRISLYYLYYPYIFFVKLFLKVTVSLPLYLQPLTISNHYRQEHPPEVFYKKYVFKNFAKFTGKQLWQSLFFNKVAGEEETLMEVFSCEFCQIFKNTLFTEHLRVTAFVQKKEKKNSKCSNCEISTLNFIMYILTILTRSLKIYIIGNRFFKTQASLNPVSMYIVRRHAQTKLTDFI